MSASERIQVNSSQNDKTNGESTAPLLNRRSTKPPLATLESINLDELDEKNDSRPRVNQPYPGVDDGFFVDDNKNDSDVETVPIVPDIGFRAGENDGKDIPDAVDKPLDKPVIPTSPSVPPSYPGTNPRFPFPSYGHDLEVGSMVPDLESIPDVNVYQHKKTLAQGMMDLALFSANANQLRYVLETFQNHPYYYPSLVLISLSLILQVAVGIGLVWNSIYNVKDEKEICLANKINNFTVIGIFLVTVLNVFISAFGVAPAPS